MNAHTNVQAHAKAAAVAPQAPAAPADPIPDVVVLGAAQAAKPAHLSWWTQLYNAVVGWQLRRAEREVVRQFAKRRYLADRGPLTDPIEREILLRLSGRRPLRRP